MDRGGAPEGEAVAAVMPSRRRFMIKRLKMLQTNSDDLAA